MRLILALVLCLGLAGCPGGFPERVTVVTWPDGRVEEVREADTAAYEAQLLALEQAVTLYRDIAEWQSGEAKVEAEQRAADRAERARQLRELLAELGRLKGES